MDGGLRRSLALCETDMDGVMRRFSGDEAFYVLMLEAFLDDPTMAELDEAIARQEWDDAFTAAHALKGLAGNMGFIPLFHATGELVVLIRTGKIQEIGASNAEVRRCHAQIVAAIRHGQKAAR